VVTRRYGHRATVVTTNKPFSDWGVVFPNGGCVVTLIDRLVHKAEIITMEGESYRVKEARERAAAKAKQRASPKSRPRGKP
jgi:DNA replication protein DnaC